MRAAYSVGPAALDDPQVLALLEIHLAGMHANSPPEAVFALDGAGLSSPDVTLFGAWSEDGSLAAIGAIKAIGQGRAEVKSMRTHPDFLRRGAGAAILDHIVEHARAHGFRRLSLETGSGPAFDPALALYRKRGFVAGCAFGDYTKSEFNQFMHLAID